MQKKFIPFLLVIAIAAGCQQKQAPVSAGTDKPQLQTNSKATIQNDIVVHEEGGLRIARAYLTDENGLLLTKNNTVQTGDTVVLHLQVKQGWVAEKGFVSLGATQTITAEKGEPVLSSPNLFAGNGKMAVADANRVQLTAVLTRPRTDTRTFIVCYRVWDINGNGQVAGQYMLHLADPPAE